MVWASNIFIKRGREWFISIYVIYYCKGLCEPGPPPPTSQNPNTDSHLEEKVLKE